MHSQNKFHALVIGVRIKYDNNRWAELKNYFIEFLLTFLLTITFLFFLCIDALHPSQQFFSHVRIPGFKQYMYLVKDKVSCSRKQHSAFGESRTCDPLISNLPLLVTTEPPWTRVQTGLKST